MPAKHVKEQTVPDLQANWSCRQLVAPSRNVQSGHCEGLIISPSNALVISVGHWEARAVKLPCNTAGIAGQGKLMSNVS